MRQYVCSVIVAPLILVGLVAPHAHAATTPPKTTKPAPVKKATPPPLQVAVWVPYWKKASGTDQLIQNLQRIEEVSPFAYEVEDDGTIIDAMKLAGEPWTTLLATTDRKKTKIIPSILWLDADGMHRVLSSTSTRAEHVADIVRAVERNNFDGIDIDYEGKKVETRFYFAQFLKELDTELSKTNKLLVCTIEARTPPSSLFKVVPKNIERANDYKAINKYCDTVRIMTYDQQTADIKLNKAKGDGVFYAPVADNSWVKKVIEETVKTIDRKKIMLGVATYGYEYSVDLTDRAQPVYTRLRAINHPDALTLALSMNALTMRNVSGEMSFAYTKGKSTRFVTWSDSSAIEGKMKIAKQYGLRGVAIFKIDGGTDPKLWEVVNKRR